MERVGRFGGERGGGGAEEGRRVKYRGGAWGIEEEREEGERGGRAAEMVEKEMRR